MIIELTVANFIVFTHSVTTNIQGLSITHSLGLSDSIELNPQLFAVENELRLTQSIQHNKEISLGVTDTLNLSQSILKVPPQFPFNHLYLYQTIEVVKPTVVKNTLSLSQTITVVKGQGVQSTLALTQTIGLLRTIGKSVSSDLLFAQHLSGYKPSSGWIFGDYTIGSAQLTLQFVYPGWNLSLPLRNPEFGNVEHLAFTRIYRKTRAGSTRMLRETHWPASRSFSYTIAGLCPGQSKKLLDFLRITIGRTVRLIDYENREWDVFIMTPAAEVSEQFSRNFSATLEFQGVLAP